MWSLSIALAGKANPGRRFLKLIRSVRFQGGKKMKKIVVILIALFMTGCINNYQRFYKPTADPKLFKNVQWLRPGEEPKIFYSNNLEGDYKSLLSKGYLRVGWSSFNGGYQMEEMVKEQARSVGATLILLQVKYTDTQTSTSHMFLPNTQTKYYSGSIGRRKFSGTTETHGTTVVPYTSQQRRYDQKAHYFVKSTRRGTFGVFGRDLTDKIRQELERNTGVYIYAVVEDSPAFISNILTGDIVLEIDGKLIRNMKHMKEISTSFDKSKDVSVWKIVRKGKEREIKIKFQ